MALLLLLLFLLLLLLLLLVLYIFAVYTIRCVRVTSTEVLLLWKRFRLFLFHTRSIVCRYIIRQSVDLQY